MNFAVDKAPRMLTEVQPTDRETRTTAGRQAGDVGRPGAHGRRCRSISYRLRQRVEPSSGAHAQALGHTSEYDWLLNRFDSRGPKHLESHRRFPSRWINIRSTRVGQGPLTGCPYSQSVGLGHTHSFKYRGSCGFFSFLRTFYSIAFGHR